MDPTIFALFSAVGFFSAAVLFAIAAGLNSEAFFAWLEGDDLR